MRLTPRALTLLTLGTLGATSIAIAGSPSAGAISSMSSTSSLSSLSSNSGTPANPFPVIDTPGEPAVMPGGFIVQIITDLLGPGISDLVGFRSGDLGIMAPLGGGEFAVIFGDSFREQGLKGEWMSPVGVVARMVDGVIEILRPLNAGDRVEQFISYFRPEGSNLTLIPSDIINLDGTLYLQGMWNNGIGNVSNTEIWKSTDSGKSWSSMGKENTRRMNGRGDLISWEKGPDGYIYAVTSSFKRADPVYLSRFLPENIGDRAKWQSFNPAQGTWSSKGTPILSDNVQAGEMNLRFIDGHWVLVMFNDATLQIEVRVSADIARDWNDVPVAVIAKNGSWKNEQTPTNFSQPYGGYIVPGSTLANMDIVISQWNTANNSRYNATQFNVRGLDEFFGTNSARGAAPQGIAPQGIAPQAEPLTDNSVVDVTQREATLTQDQILEDSLMGQRELSRDVAGQE